ncbi:MAG: beta-galactosidase trimerization domain-containing protein, partial [Lentisphaeria bacterium]|nr:beta-galactosidase trimerization domain-containing protein [Lentisphaeria bacterium]
WRNNAAEFQTLKALGSTRTGVTWGLFYSTFAHDYTWNFLLATAMGVRQWRTVSDPGTESSWRPLLAWETVHEELLAPWRPLANTGVVFSDLTQNHHPLRAGQKTFAFGFVNSVNALTDAGIVYRAVIDRDLDNDNLDRLQTLFLPGTALLSDEAIANIRRFVANGGSLIASGQIGRYRPDSSDRGNLGLADLFGVELQRYDTKTRGTRLEIAPGNVFNAGREAAGLYYNAEFAKVATTGDSKLLAELVTPDGQRWPGIVEHRFGKGRTVYFAFRPELRYALQHLSHGAPLVEPGKPWEDHRTAAFGRLIVDAVNRTGSQPVSVDNSTSGIMVDAHRQRTGDIDNIVVAMTNFLGVELANGVVPKHLDPAFPEVAPHLPDPQAPFKIHLRAPPPKSVYLVSPDYTTAARLPFTHDDGAVHVTLDRLDRIAIIVLTYGRDLVEKIYGAAIADQQPDAVDVIIREVPPLVGKYDPDAVVVFADIAPGFKGGRDHGAYKQQPSRIIYGARSPYPQVRATLTLAKLPGYPVLTVGGMDDNWPNHYAPIEILVNGTSLFKGKTDFPDNEWDTRDYEIPPGILKVGDNTVVVRNLGDSASPSTPPWFGIAFLKIADTQ